jgi:hypothetical protein
LNNRFERITILKAPTFGGGCLLDATKPTPLSPPLSGGKP